MGLSDLRVLFEAEYIFILDEPFSLFVGILFIFSSSAIIFFAASEDNDPKTYLTRL